MAEPNTPATAPVEAPSLADGLLLECVVTSSNEDGSTNVAPMGPIVDHAMTRVLLRPYQSSTTFQNLARTGCCVLHVTDDVELIAHAALDLLAQAPPMHATPSERGMILTHACRWYELEALSIDTSQQRSEITCRVMDRGRLRDFVGFNRAMSAVIEATILATRLEYLPIDDIRSDLDRLATAVEKTGGPRERRAFGVVLDFVNRHAG